jgi:hypothetical protein
LPGSDTAICEKALLKAKFLLVIGLKKMFSHLFTSVTDFERSLKFYEAIMNTLELEQRFCDVSKPWAGWHSEGKRRRWFVELMR